MQQSEEERFEEQYLEARMLDNALSESANFLMAHGWMVIPKGKIEEFLGAYKITAKTEETEETDEIPF